MTAPAATQQYARALPRTIIVPLDTALDLTQYLPQIPPGSLLTMISFQHVDSGVSLQLSFGGQLPALTILQGQTISFGGSGDCPGVMDLGIYLGTGGIAVAGGTVQLFVTFFGGFASLQASQ